MMLHAVSRSGRNPQLPWIIWLHGFLGSREEWAALSDNFADWPQLVVDLPGHGGSAEIAAEDFVGVNKLLQNTLISYNILRYWLVGYSLGGRIAMYHACQKEPSGLRGLIVEGGHPGLYDDNERESRWLTDSRWAARFRHEDIHTVLNDWYRQPVFRSLEQRQRARLVALRSKNNPQRLAQMLEATSLSRQPDFREMLRHISVPFHYLCGERDAKFRAVAADLGVTPELISAAGHNAHREAPDAFSARLLTLLHRYDLRTYHDLSR